MRSWDLGLVPNSSRRSAFDRFDYFHVCLPKANGLCTLNNILFVCFSLLRVHAENQSSQMHLAVQREYPTAERLPLPPNIDATEAARFSPLRNRDITSSEISVHHKIIGIDVTLDQLKPEVKMESVEFDDPHLGSYDRHSSVNLSSVMQSTVPEPLGGNNKFTHLNMPGGSWSQQTKYLSHELNSNHYTQLRQDIRSEWSQYSQEGQKGSRMSAMNSVFTCSLLKPNCLIDHQPFLTINKRFISLSSKNFNEQALKTPGESEEKPPVKESAQSKLKKAVKEYGSTVIVFHVGISLISLGVSYLLVSRYVNFYRFNY